MYSHLSNKRGGGILWKNLMHNSNKQGVEGGKKSKESINVEGGIFLWRVEFLKMVSKRGPHVY